MDKENEGNENERELNIISNTRNTIILSNNNSPVFKILFAFGNKSYQYEIISKDSFKKLSTIEYTDDILSLQSIETDIIIAGKQNKSISRLGFNSEIKYSFVHNKKLSSLLLITEQDVSYLLYSDKFGEIHLKKIEDDKEKFAEKGKILFGHCDPVTFLQLSPNHKLLLSSDSFGKIKVYQFPNCFNVLTVILYKNEQIKYVNFISEESIIVLTNENELNLWSTYDFILVAKYEISVKEEENDEILSIGVLGINMIYVETKQKVYCFNVDAINRKFILHLEYSKSKADDVKATRIFMFNNKDIFLASFGSDYLLSRIDTLGGK